MYVKKLLIAFLISITSYSYNANIQHNMQDFFNAAIQGDSKGIEETLKSIDINSRDEYNNKTALMLAAEFGHAKLVESLVLNYDANIDLQDKYGNTALMLALTNCHIEVANLLLNLKAEALKKIFKQVHKPQVKEIMLGLKTDALIKDVIDIIQSYSHYSDCHGLYDNEALLKMIQK